MNTTELEKYLAPPFEHKIIRHPEWAVMVLGRVIHGDGHSGYDKFSADDKTLRDACRQWQGWNQPFGFDKGDLIHAGLPSRMRFPKNIPWTDFPVIGGPYYGCNLISFNSWLSYGNRAGDCEIPFQILLEGVNGRPGLRCILLREIPWMAPHMLMHEVHCLREAGMPELPVMFMNEEMEIRTVHPDEIRDAALRCRAGARFSWCWQVNAEALLPALITEAYRTRRPPKNSDANGTSGSGWEKTGTNAIAHNPLALQVLYHVAEINPKPLSYDKRTCRFIGGYPGILEGAGTVRVSGGNAALAWPGSEKLTEGATSVLVKSLESACSALERAGMLLPDENRKARLAHPGAALLKLLPRGCRDPGMPVRWLTSEGMNGADGDVPAMDRWLMSAMRRIKRAASDLRKEDIVHNTEK